MVRITGIRLINFGALRSIIKTNIPMQKIPYKAMKMNDLIQEILFLNDLIPRKTVKLSPMKASIKNVKSMSFICLFFLIPVCIVQAFAPQYHVHTFFNA